MLEKDCLLVKIMQIGRGQKVLDCVIDDSVVKHVQPTYIDDGYVKVYIICIIIDSHLCIYIYTMAYIMQRNVEMLLFCATEVITHYKSKA